MILLYWYWLVHSIFCSDENGKDSNKSPLEELTELCNKISNPQTSYDEKLYIICESNEIKPKKAKECQKCKKQAHNVEKSEQQNTIIQCNLEIVFIDQTVHRSE